MPVPILSHHIQQLVVGKDDVVSQVLEQFLLVGLLLLTLFALLPELEDAYGVTLAEVVAFEEVTQLFLVLEEFDPVVEGTEAEVDGAEEL